jgi:sugar (pentulose or hexulose) kinase
MQSISSGLGIPVQLLGNQESNCLAATLCAGIGVGIWPDAGAAKAAGVFHKQKRYKPNSSQHEALAAAQTRFRASMQIAQQLWSLN